MPQPGAVAVNTADVRPLPERLALRNGHRPKLVSTPAGDVGVGIPKLRTGSFFPELLEPRRRIDKALWAVIMTAYVTGTSANNNAAFGAARFGPAILESDMDLI